MHIVEVMVAGSVFLGASCSSLQIWAASGNSAQQWIERRQALERSEQDRLLLEAHWRRSLTAALDCNQAAASMASLAQQAAADSTLQRSVQLNPDGRSLSLQWRSVSNGGGSGGSSGFERTRLVAPAGLGLCTPAAEVPA
jgi:hypothetical protein